MHFIPQGPFYTGVGQSGRGCDGMERERGCEAVDQAGGRASDAAGQVGLGLARLLYCISKQHRLSFKISKEEMNVSEPSFQILK